MKNMNLVVFKQQVEGTDKIIRIVFPAECFATAQENPTNGLVDVHYVKEGQHFETSIQESFETVMEIINEATKNEVKDGK